MNKIKYAALFLVGVVCLIIGIAVLNANSEEKDITFEEADVSEISEASLTEEVNNEPDYYPVESATPTAQICVYVCGCVKNPGVYVLDDGSRVNDAVIKAGGLTEDAFPEALNLASLAADGMKIYVPCPEEAEYFDPGDTSETQEDSGNSKVNINTADVAALTTLSGIGESKAKCIISYREEHGSFQTVEEIMNVEGIKEGSFNKIKNDICVR